MENKYTIPDKNSRFYRILEETGLSQKKFGKILGLSHSQINNIISGRRGVTSMLVELLKYKLNVNPERYRPRI